MTRSFEVGGDFTKIELDESDDYEFLPSIAGMPIKLDYELDDFVGANT